ncbi:MAG: hypothetical protein ACYDBJ_27410 [Aggregatilineales bacterium]
MSQMTETPERPKRRQRTPDPNRRRGLTLAGLVIGAVIGLSLGLVYAWEINPVVQTDVSAWQLNAEGQTDWLIAVSVAWAHDGDLVRAANRLNDLHWSDQTFQKVAQAACDLARSSYAQSQAGLVAIRSMAALAQSQGKTACASAVVALSSPTSAPSLTVIPSTATLAPPPSKTPTLGPTFTPPTQAPPTPTSPPSEFRIVRYEPYCSVKTPGLLEVLVQQPNGTGIPGIAIRVDSAAGTDQFFTGLEPEHDAGYADFFMKSDQTYTVALVGSSVQSDPLKAAACTDRAGGGASVTSYRVYFRRVPRQ